MVHFCCVPGCSNRSSRERHLSYFALPLKNKKLLRIWIHKIGRKKLPINKSTRICSEHFLNATGRRLRPDEYPSLKLPVLRTTISITQRKPPKERHSTDLSVITSDEAEELTCDVAVNTEPDWNTEISELKKKINVIEEEKMVLQKKQAELLEQYCFRLNSICNDDNKILFYTGFPDYKTFMACFNFLGPAVNNLTYWDSGKQSDTPSRSLCKTGRSRALTPLEEFFLVLVRLRLGLLEKDLAYRFNVSASTISRIWKTWIAFLYLQFKEIPMWPSREMVNAYMPKCFNDAYPSTRVILDATEIRIQKPTLSEFQQMTFSNYKNTNTYKVLIGISPSGAITFVSKVYPGAISDTDLTIKSGILDLLDSGDSVMADRGFTIQNELSLIGVKLNIPPFLRGKAQLSSKEMVETRRIASLRIHVERAMERIKNFHIFDRALPSTFETAAEQVIFICATLSNFHPPLCM